MYVGEALFIRGDLDAALRHQISTLKSFVDGRYDGLRGQFDDDSIIATLAKEAAIAPLEVDFDNPLKDVQAARVRVHDWGREIEIDGVRATRSYPFSGDAGLFDLKPNQYWSMLPRGYVSGRSIVVGIEGRNDPEMLKRELEQQEKLLRDYVASQKAQIEAHNRELTLHIAEHVARRRQHLDSVSALKDLL
jgi:hypothetical protein